MNAAAPPILAYWTALLVAIGLFTGLTAAFEGLGGDVGIVLVGMWGATLGGTAIGQGLALLRARMAVVLAGSVISWLVGWWALLGQAAALQATAAGEAVGVAVVMIVLLGPFFVLCGYWSLSTNTGILATFGPLVWFTGAILNITEQTDAMDRWHAGAKWAIWNVLTAPILGIGVMLIVFFLAARELYRLHRWRFGSSGPDVPLARRAAGMGVPNPGWGGMGVLVMLGLLVTVSGAFVAPYLWQTGPGDRQGDGGRTSEQEHASERGHRDRTEWQRNDDATGGEGIGGRNELEQARKAAEEAAFSLLMLVLMLLLALSAALVFGPPLRRMVLLQHLRRPLWPVPPTRRVEQHWRLVEIALGDLGIQRRRGDSAESLVRRAAQQVDFVDPDALFRCAAVADRVRYGIGVMPDDPTLARRTAEMTYQAVWEVMTEKQKFRAVYRFL